MDLAELGQSIRAAREKARLTQAQVAKAARLSRTTVNQIERGTVTDVGIRKVLDLCDHLQLSLDVKPRPAPRTLSELHADHEEERRAAQQANDTALSSGSGLAP